MPRFAILTGTRHGENSPVIIADATHPLPELQTQFKDLVRPRFSEEFAEVQLWTSDAGIIRRARLKKPAPDPAPDPTPTPDAGKKAKAGKKPAE